MRPDRRLLGAALDWIAAQAGTTENPAGSLVEGRKLLVENAETIAQMTRAAALALGFRLFAPDAPASAATALLPPPGTDSGLLVKELKSRFAAVITNGQGEMKGQIFRIAHLGYFDYMDTIALIGALEQVVVKSLPQLNKKFGDGLIAAQQVYADRIGATVPTSPCFCGRTDQCCSIKNPSFGAGTETDNVSATNLDPRTKHETVGA